MFDPSIPAVLRDAVERELRPNERIEWIEKPRPAFFTPLSSAKFLFGIPWTAFAVFWTVCAAWGTQTVPGGAGPFIFFPLFGTPFILIGIGMLSAPVLEYFRSLKTVYVITDERAISFSVGKAMTVRSYSPERLQDLFRREKSNGSGDIIFSRNSLRSEQGEQGFFRIEDVRSVEQKLNNLAEQHTPHRATPI